MAGTYLTATYRDREQVKTLGARWDAEQRRWFVPEGRDLAPFQAWLPDAVASLPVAASPSTELATRKGVSLSQLLAGVAQAVSQAYKAGVWTRVEVVKVDARKGHVYLELSERSAQGDSVAQARAVIWAETANQIVPAFEQATGVVLGAGIKLLVRAKPAVHPLYGLSLVIDGIDPEYTLGDLEAKKREIRARLQREGLFELNRKLPQPWDFNSVLVAAPQGAAGLGDFQGEAERLQRHGLCDFVYAYSRFQGEGAAAEVRAALVGAIDGWRSPTHSLPDAVVIIRGGGAVNDLAWLNDYELARCICELDIPVLTGIGHERDNTVLDEVANQRFDTPSKVIAGIEQVIKRRADEAQAHFDRIVEAARRATQLTRRAIEKNDGEVRNGAQRSLMRARQRAIEDIGVVRVASGQWLRRASENARDRFAEVRESGREQLARGRELIPALFAEVRSGARQGLREATAGCRVLVDDVLDRTRSDIKSKREATDRDLDAVARDARRVLADGTLKAEAMMREIAGQGPEKTLGRGFAIVRKTDGTTITSAGAATADEVLDIAFRDGSLKALALGRGEKTDE